LCDRSGRGSPTRKLQRRRRRLRQAIDRRSHPLAGLFVRHLVVGRAIVAREHLHEGPHIVVTAARPLINAHHAVALVAALGVDGLIGGDRIDPRANLAARLELVALQMDLQERLLEDVFGHFGITQVVPKVAVQLRFKAVDQFLEHPLIPPRAILQQELFVGPYQQRVGATSTRSQLFNCAVHFCYAFHEKRVHSIRQSGSH
jgi:hypothetical protein